MAPVNYIGLIIACCLAGYAISEHCFETSDCSHITCTGNYELECHFNSTADENDPDVYGECTCTDKSQSCDNRSECTGDCTRRWHCVDNLCRCGFGDFGR